VRRLIVCADDMGLHPGINAGILQCHKKGIVTSASLSPSGVAFDEACRLLRGVPDLDVGVHLTLVGEASVSAPGTLPTLAPEGRFPKDYAALFRQLLMRRIRVQEVEAELDAQLARVRDEGIQVSHLDSHQHVHLHPALLPVVMRLAARFGVGALRAASRVIPMTAMKPALIALFARRGVSRIRKAGLKTPDVFLGLADTGRIDEARLLRLVRLLGRLPVGTGELVCHPGAGDSAIARAYAWGFRWDAEAAALTSPAVREALARERIQLIAYRDL
jgi:hopanoid biosynthesis associated protein HpnK